MVIVFTVWVGEYDTRMVGVFDSAESAVASIEASTEGRNLRKEPLPTREQYPDYYTDADYKRSRDYATANPCYSYDLTSEARDMIHIRREEVQTGRIVFVV